MTKNPIIMEENTLATEILSHMNKKKSQIYVYLKKAIKEK